MLRGEGRGGEGEGVVVAGYASEGFCCSSFELVCCAVDAGSVDGKVLLCSVGTRHCANEALLGVNLVQAVLRACVP